MVVIDRLNNTSFFVKNIKELENFIIKYKLVNDFICFRETDYYKLEILIKTTNKIGITKLRRKLQSVGLFNIKSKNQIEYWLCRGQTELIAKDYIKKWSITSSEKFVRKRKLHPELYSSSYTNQLQYWINLGFNEKEAKEKLKERQTTFSLEKCIIKYGEVLGKKRFNDRQKLWIDSLYNKKTAEEKEKFNYKKVVKFNRSSKSSLEIFLPVIKHLIKNKILTNDEYYIGYDEKNEFHLKVGDGTIRYYDFTIPKLKKIIEFNGDKFHIKKYDETNSLKNPYGVSLNEIYERDIKKIDLARSNGYDVLVIWEEDGVDQNIKKCIEFIENEKYNS